ncbi:MAG: NUDIX domain-containing protein [Acidimicrobiales bacterium]
MTEQAAFYRGLPAKRAGAGILIVRKAEEILLVRPTYKDHWEIPGGACEADESPAAAAGREVREELALDCAIGRLLVVDWTPPAGARTQALGFPRNRGGWLIVDSVSPAEV